MKSCVPSALALLALSPLSFADLELDKFGGAVPGTIEFDVQGDAGELVAVVLSTLEVQSQPLPGVTLEVGLDQILLTFQIPGLFGVLDGSGLASANLTVPNTPSLIGARLSAQALQGPDFTEVSNLVRVTLQAPDTFAETLEFPTLPIAGGAVADLGSGQRLFAGGSGPVAQVYDSRTEEWEVSGVSFGVGLLSQSTGLADGRILFTGGLDLTSGQPTAAAALYDPATQTTTDLSMTTARAAHQASLLSNGQVMITGGFGSLSTGGGTDLVAILLQAFQGLLASTEVFDPVAMTFSPGPNMLEARAFHGSTALDNGDVLIAGGMTLLPIVNLPVVSNTAYQYVPSLQSFGLPKFFDGPRLLQTQVKLDDGSVLLAGGLTLDLSTFLQTGQITDLTIGALTDVQRYTTGFFGGFGSVGDLSVPRAAAGSAVLPGNGALLLGGLSVVVSATELTFEPSASADRFTLGSPITPTGDLSAPRLFPLVEPLDDGTVLVVGGGPTTSEVFQP